MDCSNIIKVKALIWYSPILNLVGIWCCFTTQPPAGNLPNLGVSHHLEVIQISVQLRSHTGLVQVLSYPLFAGTHFTYPQWDGGLSQPPARLGREWVLNLGPVAWQSTALTQLVIANLISQYICEKVKNTCDKYEIALTLSSLCHH